MKVWYILCAWLVLVVVLSLGAFKLGYAVHTLDYVRNDVILIKENVREMKYGVILIKENVREMKYDVILIKENVREIKYDVVCIQQKIDDLSDKLESTK